MLFHQGKRSLFILQKLYMAQLIDLVKADSLHTHKLLHILLVCFAGRHHRDSRSGKGDLGRGSVFKHHIRIPGFAAQSEYIREWNKIPLKFMDTIGIVPHDHEVRCSRLQLGKTPDRLIAVDDTVRVGVLRNTPDSLDVRVFYKLLHLIHIGSRGGHSDRDQLRAEALRYAEMSVIARSRAEEFYLFQLSPGLLAVEQSVGVGFGDGVVHQIQARIAADKALFRPAAKDVGKQCFRAREARQRAIISHIHIVCQAFIRLRQNRQNSADEIQLFFPRFPAGHVQLQAPGLQHIILFPALFLFLQETGSVQFLVFHVVSSFFAD